MSDAVLSTFSYTSSVFKMPPVSIASVLLLLILSTCTRSSEVNSAGSNYATSKTALYLNRFKEHQHSWAAPKEKKSREEVIFPPPDIGHFLDEWHENGARGLEVLLQLSYRRVEARVRIQCVRVRECARVYMLSV